MGEKRVFVKKLDESGKADLKTKFYNQLNNAIKGKIDIKEIIETENDRKWSLMFCDGVRIYSMVRFKVKPNPDELYLYTFDEKQKIKKFFAVFTGKLLKEFVDLKNVDDEDSPESYKVRYLNDGKEIFSMIYEKKKYESEKE